jgi:hypothetical protein
MTVDKLTTIWAEDGDLGDPAPTTAKQETGWVGGDRPYVEWFNRLQNRVEKIASDLAEFGPNSTSTDVTTARDMITTGLWNASDTWGTTSDTLNVIDGGDTKEYRDLMVYFDSDNYPFLIAADNAAMKFDIYNARTRAFVESSDDLTADLPTADTPAWEIESACTDGTHVYAVFCNTSAVGDDEYRAQAWLISDWSVHSDWPATGLQLSSTGTLTDGFRKAKVIIASDDTIAIAKRWVTISSSSSAAIMVVAKDFSGSEGGAGDAPTLVSGIPTGSLTSDGTNLFFGVYEDDTVDSLYVCSAIIDLDDMTAGCGGTGYPYELSVSTLMAIDHMVSCGPKLNVVAYNYSTQTAVNVVLATNNAGDAWLDRFYRGQNSGATPVVGDQFVLENCLSCCFDGTNVWLLAIIDFPTGYATNKCCALVKIDAAKFSVLNTSPVRGLQDVASVFLIAPDETQAYSSYAKVVFDGSNIWCTIEHLASEDNSGKIFRLPMALVRS